MASCCFFLALVFLILFWDCGQNKYLFLPCTDAQGFRKTARQAGNTKLCPMSVHVLSWLLFSVLVLLRGALVDETLQEKCVKLDAPQNLDGDGFYQDGDVIIGTLINVHNLAATPDLSFIRKAELAPCLE